MRQLLIVVPMALALSGCAASGTVQRIAVDYNTAVSGMANEVTLLNIVRAKEGLPLHYTSIGRLTGNVTMKASGNVNGQIKDNTRTTVDTLANTTAPAGTTIVQTLSDTVVRGGDVLIPTLGGEISTGPSFDITILDSQKFYQGILAPVPFTTIETYLNQGYDNELILRLFVESVVYRAKAEYRSPDGLFVIPQGTVLAVKRNAASGPESREFLTQYGCYQLVGGVVPGKSKVIGPISRVTLADSGKAKPLSVEDLLRFDGKSYELDGQLGANSAGDAEVFIKRLGAAGRAPQFLLRRECYALQSVSDEREPIELGPTKIPAAPPAEPTFVGDGRMMVLGPDNKALIIEATGEIVFRSPEGVIRFLGAYLAASEDPARAAETYRLAGLPIFSVQTGNVRGAVVSTDLLGQRYSIANNGNLRRNGEVLAIVQQLVNLQKESSDRPVTIPIQLLP